MNRFDSDRWQTLLHCFVIRVRSLLTEDSFNIEEEQVRFYINEGNKKTLEIQSSMWIKNKTLETSRKMKESSS